MQIVRYENRKLIVVSHVGSAHTKEEEGALKLSAQDHIKKISKQASLFTSAKQEPSNMVSLEKCKYLGFQYCFMYETLSRIFIHFKFHKLRNNILNDLVLMRIAEPTSKLRSIELLNEYFGIKYLRKRFYEALAGFADFKNKAETKALDIAKKEFNFDFSFVFYDVTTLYFESFKPDELRKHGFSKDNKSQQPQIVIGLVVTQEGFPVAYEVFEGNKFEGHTLIPVIHKFQARHRIKTLTVVADAAMLSFENIKALEANALRYIVGARMGNLPFRVIENISKKLNQRDGAHLRTTTSHGDIVCAFSSKRYAKGGREMENQIKKAEVLVKAPSALRRTKFLRNKDKANLELNTELIEKTKLLLGIKGYYTNLGAEVSNQTIIDHYHGLWHVEQAFRIAKSDLQMRPIYHFKKEAIETHVLICFMALAVCKYMEIKTGKSTKKIVELFKNVTDARILNTLTNQEIIMRSPISEKLKQALSQLGL